jgi:hypothetical protein
MNILATDYWLLTTGYWLLTPIAKQSSNTETPFRLVEWQDGVLKIKASLHG